MALPSNPINGQYVKPSDDVVYKYNSSDNSFRTFNPEGEYVSVVEYSYRYKNAGGNISAPYIGEDDVLTIEIPYNFKQEIYNPSNVGNQFTITLPESIPSSSGIPTVDGSVLVRELDIFSWSISGDLNAAKERLAGAGTQDAALAFGGSDNAGYFAATEKFNGSTWNTNAGWDLNTARDQLAGVGSQDAALSFGGYNNVSLHSAVTEKFDGSTWTTNAGWDLNTARRALAGAGIQSAALAFGGSDISSFIAATEKFDGSTWTTNAGWDLNTARHFLAGVGEQNAALSFGASSGNLAVTEKFDGSSWSTQAGWDLNTPRYSLAGAGEQNAALAFGGFDGSVLAATEKFDGSSWRINAGWDLNTARNLLAGAGTQNAALSFGGADGIELTTTEKFGPYLSNNLGIFNKGENNADYPFGTAITISGDQLVIADSLTANDVDPTIEVSYLSTARERDGISVFGDANLENDDETYDTVLFLTELSGVDDNRAYVYDPTIPAPPEVIEDFSYLYIVDSATPALIGQERLIISYNQTYGYLLLDSPFTSNLNAGDTFEVRNPKTVTLAKIYNSIIPEHYASVIFNRYTETFRIEGDYYLSSGDSFTSFSGDGVSSGVDLDNKKFELRITEKFNTLFGQWNGNFDFYYNGNEDEEAEAFKTFVNLFYDTIEVLSEGKFNINDVAIAYGDPSRIDILAEEVAYNDVEPDVYYEIKEYGEYILETSNAVNYIISNNGSIAVPFWVIGASPSQSYSYFGAAGNQNSSIIAGGGAVDIQRTEIFNGSYWIEAGDLNSNQMEYNKLVGGPSSALTVGNTYGNIVPDEKYDGVSWSIGATSSDNEEVAEAGIPTAALKAGGFSASSLTEKYDGISWITNASWNLNTGRIATCGTGSQNAAFAITGQINTTEKFDGTSWSASATTSISRDSAAADGNVNAAILMGGSSGGALASVEVYNGDSWSFSTSMLIAFGGLASSGNSSNTIAITGSDSQLLQNNNSFRIIKDGNIDVIDDEIELSDTSATFQIIRNNSFGGGTWSFTGNLNTARTSLAGAGNQSAALSFGGTSGTSSVVTEKFDGSSWITQSDWNLSNARFGLAGVGEQNAALSFGGTPSGAVTEKFDGSSWITQSGWFLNAPRLGPAGAGAQNTALSFGGNSSSAVTEKFNGNTWTTNGAWDLNAGREGLAGTGIQNAALGFGGYDGSALAVTEKFDGSSWFITGNLNTTRRLLAGTGGQNASLGFNGFDGSSYLASTEKFNGSFWAVAVDSNIARRGLAGAGSQNAGLSFGGNDLGGNLAVAEKFDYTPEVSAILTY